MTAPHVFNNDKSTAISKLLKEIKGIRDLIKDAAPEQREELQMEVRELVIQVNNLINEGKATIKTKYQN